MQFMLNKTPMGLDTLLISQPVMKRLVIMHNKCKQFEVQMKMSIADVTVTEAKLIWLMYVG